MNGVVSHKDGGMFDDDDGTGAKKMIDTVK